MIYQVQIQFLPSVDTIWVAKINQDDPIYEYDNEVDAQQKAEELQSVDTTGRIYKIQMLNILAQ
jgi:hypothetical protein